MWRDGEGGEQGGEWEQERRKGRRLELVGWEVGGRAGRRGGVVVVVRTWCR